MATTVNYNDPITGVVAMQGAGYTPQQIAASQTPAAQSPSSPVPQQPTPTAPVAAQGAGNALYNPNAGAGMAGSLDPTLNKASTSPVPSQPQAQSSGVSAPKENLQPGQQGQDVSGLQSFLTSLGYMTPQQVATGSGIYGPQTQAAVAKLQKDLGVDTTGGGAGFYGPKTQAAISQKYKDAFANSSGTIPENASQAQTAIDKYVADNKEDDVQQSYFEHLFDMNPVEATIFQQMSNLFSSQTTQQSLSDFYKQEVAARGIPELQVQFADIKKIMDGSEDDIRTEVAMAGGSATESQIQALTGARNKTLLRQAEYLSNVINSKNDYVDKIVQLTQMDRDAAEKQLDRKLNLGKTMFDMADSMQNAARQNVQSVVNSIGWDGLAQTVANNPQAAAQIERVFGMSPGELQSIAKYKKPLTATEQLQLENAKLQNLKLRQDVNSGPEIKTTVIDLGGGHKKLINSQTGATIADYNGETAPTIQKLAMQQQNINDMDGLIKDPALGAAVGVNPLTRFGVSDFTGAKSNFIGTVEQLRQQMTLDQLVNAKANGATFGALSEGELKLLSQSATKIGSWAIKDKAGNVTGYDIDEKDFKQELDKINYFQKLDFLLKGGDPTSVGAKEMPDGTYWVPNSDGTYSQLK